MADDLASNIRYLHDKERGESAANIKALLIYCVSTSHKWGPGLIPHCSIKSA